MMTAFDHQEYIIKTGLLFIYIIIRTIVKSAVYLLLMILNIHTIYLV